MTSYFDDADRAVYAASKDSINDIEFLQDLGVIELAVIRDVSLVTGDREFPEEHREKMQSIMSEWRTTTFGNVDALAKAVRHATATHSSRMIADLHEAFHRLAGERIKVRFGFLSDKPDGNLIQRAAHDAEAQGLEFDRDTDTLVPRHDWMGG